MKFKLIFTLLIVFLSFGCKTSTNNTSETEQKPNVVIILADDMGYGDISCYGQTGYTTPNIDNIAAHGVSLTDFYVPTPYCAPSRATLLSGRFPLRHGMIKNPHPDTTEEAFNVGISPSEILMPEIFKASGYATKAIGKWHMGHKEKFFPINNGFDEYYGILYSNDMLPIQIIQDRDTIQYPVDQRQLTTNYTKQAVDFINRKKDSSFFLYLAHSMPHKPLAVSDKFYTPETPNDLYKDVIKELDWSVGEVMKTLTDLQLLENTIVIFMSDNGPYYGGSTGGFKGMKATTWEGGIRVPFIISYPKVFPENKKVSVPLWSPDVLPTLLALTNTTPEKMNMLDGQNIVEILKGNETKHPPVFSLHNDKILSIRKGNFKLFLNKPNNHLVNIEKWVDKKAPNGINIIAQTEGQPTPEQYPGVIPQKSKNKIQLFNLVKDPTETEDLAKKNTSKVNELLQDYKTFVESLPVLEDSKKVNKPKNQ
ncbi:MAG: sulfatase-like hydrolase/transferase [Polaribacter sp.]